MYPILYEKIEPGTIPQNNGLGVLSDSISCEVEQERNGIYELVMEYPMTGIHAKEIAYRRILKAKPNPTDNPQLFRIDRIGKVMNGRFTVFAKHISYDLSGNEITSGTASTAAAACALLDDAAPGYNITTDKTSTGTFKIETPGSVRSYFAGREGSILDAFGTAEIKYDNFDITFKQHAGQDRGETIRYGKNLLELSQEIDGSNLYTHVLCFYKTADSPAVVGSKVATGLELDTDRCLILDVSNEYQEAPTSQQLTQKATEYIANNNLTVPTNNITLDFVQSGELTNRVDLCDTVTIYYEALGISRTQIKCIRTKYDCIRGKYIETEFGDAKTNLADTIVQNNKAIEEKPNTTFMEEAVKRATELITGNRGGYVVMHDSNGDGEPDEILIMDTASIETARKIWRWNQNGLGYSSTGYDGTFGTAITADGRIVANFITTGTLSANRIKAGVLSDTQGNSTIDMTTGAATMKEFKSKTAFWLVNSDNEAKGLLYIDSAGNTWFSLRAASSDKDLVRFWANDANGSGVFNILKTNGNAIVEAGNAGYGGGGIGIRNNNNVVIGELKEGSGHDGMLYLKNSIGGDTIWCLGQSGAVTCVSLTQTSSRKVKENIKPMTSEEAEKILQLEAVSFDYKNKDQGTDKRGFIAEEVEKILPNLVSPETDKIPATLDYIEMIPYLQKVIKDQQETIEDLKNRLEQLEKSK